MRSVVASVSGSLAIVALLSTSSCFEPKRSNGEACLSEDQCESGFCRAGVCATAPETNDFSSLPPPDDAATEATDDAADDVTEDVAEDAPEEAADDAADDVADDVADDAEQDAEQDAAEEAAADAADDAADATSD